MKNRKIVLSILAVISLIAITVGITVAFFSYSRQGSTENTVRAGSISFIYEEVNKMGNGISITDALPVSDNEGKESNNYFDFKVTSTSASTIVIPYEITTRVVDGSDDISDYVKVYLTKVNGASEQQVALSIYSDLNDSSNTLASLYGDKTLYTDEIPVGANNYIENYRLRMWLNNDSNDGRVLDYSPVYACSDTTYTSKESCEENGKVWNPTDTYTNQNKTFSIKVNVYANGETATQQKIASATTTGITGLSVNGVNATENNDTTLNYDYSVETNMENVNNLEIVPVNPNETYTVENITEQEANALRGISTNNFNLSYGVNYLKVTVTAANRVDTREYVVRVNVIASPDNTLHSLSIEGCPLNEEFSSNTTSYTCTTESSSLTPTYTTQSMATVTVSGNNNLLPGTNSLTISVRAEDTSIAVKTYTITVTRQKSYTEVSGDSILSILKDNNLSEGYYTFKVNDKSEQYNVHLYSYDNLVVDTDTKFGAEEDVSNSLTGTRQEADAMVIVQVSGNLTNNAKIEPYYNTSTGYGGPKGFLIYVGGTLTNNGIIDNTHGAYATGQDVWLWKNQDGSYEYVPAVGAAGGKGYSSSSGVCSCYESNGKVGSAGSTVAQENSATKRATGGGGSGSADTCCNQYKVVAGGKGSSYSGGVGSGAAEASKITAAVSNIGGAGGSGKGTGAGKGAGNPSGGTGGLLIIYANEYNNGGTVSTKGSSPATATYAGGSSGGGSINIFANSITNVGDTYATGGTAVGKTKKGGAGGAGTVNIGSIATGSYVAN